MAVVATGSLAERLASRCNGDGEFRLAARFWDGSLSIDIGAGPLDLVVEGGVIEPGTAARNGGYIGLRGPAETWAKVLSPVPPPFHNDIMPAMAFGIVIEGEEETWWQYYPAVRRVVDLLREEVQRDGTL